jgi:hypothetical protein
MKKSLYLCSIAIAAVALLAGTAGAASVSYNFDTDQSSSFATVEFGTHDSAVAWTYNYASHVQPAPAIDVPIPSAPRSTGGTTSGVQIQVNLSLAAANSITLYPDVSSLSTLASGGDWRMTFDVWANHNGDAGGNTGSTEFFGFGAQATNTTPGMGSDGTNGFNYILTGDGGATVDARYSEGTAAPMTIDNNKPAWWNNPTLPNANFNVNADWIAFFPNDGTNGTPPTGTVLVGAPGKQWLTFRLEVTNSGATRTVAVKRTTDADFTVISTITTGIGSTARPCIGYADYFTGVATQPDDMFAVFDNLLIEEIVTEVEVWEKY